MAWWGIGQSLGPNINEEPDPRKAATKARFQAAWQLSDGPVAVADLLPEALGWLPDRR
jgi:hypothetical protein